MEERWSMSSFNVMWEATPEKGYGYVRVNRELHIRKETWDMAEISASIPGEHYQGGVEFVLALAKAVDICYKLDQPMLKYKIEYRLIDSEVSDKVYNVEVYAPSKEIVEQSQYHKDPGVEIVACFRVEDD